MNIRDFEWKGDSSVLFDEGCIVVKDESVVIDGIRNRELVEKFLENYSARLTEFEDGCVHTGKRCPNSDIGRCGRR